MGAELVLTAGLLGLTIAQVPFARLPVGGHFTGDLLPGFAVVAAALGLAFVGDVIASTAGIKPADAGLASGLINASQQIGGAIGLAVATSVAAARTAALLRAATPHGAGRRVPRRVHAHRRPGPGRRHRGGRPDARHTVRQRPAPAP